MTLIVRLLQMVCYPSGDVLRVFLEVLTQFFNVLFKGNILHSSANVFAPEWRIPLLALCGPRNIVCPLKTHVKDMSVDNFLL